LSISGELGIDNAYDFIKKIQGKWRVFHT
jgi:hypothetical protein